MNLRLRSDIVDKKFIKTVSILALPVAMQCMLQSSFCMIDQMMIGQLGSSSITAVGVAGKFSSIYTVIVNSVAAVAGIMIAQYIGAKKEKESFRSFFLNSMVASIVSLLFMMVSIIFSENIIGIYTDDILAVDEGAIYLTIISLSFIPTAISTVTATWLRSNERAYIPLITSIIAVVCNTGLNYILIFGKFGVGAMGAKGAAYATLASQIINMILMVASFIFFAKKDSKRIDFGIKLEKMTAFQYLMILFPILINEFLWSLGENVYAYIYGHLDDLSFAAMTLTNPIQGLIMGALSGLSAAAGIIVGKLLGKKEYDNAYKDSKRLMVMGLVGSVALSLILVMLSELYVSIYNVEDYVKETATMLLFVFALYAPVKVSNMIVGAGILRSGGNTKIVMIIDIIGTWIFGVPLGFFAAYYLNQSIVGVYLILSFEEVIRLIISIIIFRQKKWMYGKIQV